MRPSAWFGQILAEGAILALFVVFSIFVRSPPIQLLCLVVVLYVLWMLFRNPQFFYRRLAHLALWTLLLPPLSALSVHLMGYSRAEIGGIVSIALDVGGSAPPLLLAVVIVVFVAADIGTMFADGARSRRRLSVIVQSAELFLETDGRSDSKISLIVTAPAGAGATIGAVAKVRPSQWARWTDATVHRPNEGGGSIPLGDDEVLKLQAETSVSFFVKGVDSRHRKWLLWYSRFHWLAFSYGAIRLTAPPEPTSPAIPVRFDLKAPEPSDQPPITTAATGPEGE